MPNAVEVSGLRKSYGQVHAVRDVGFTVGYGEIVALLGPNGAGNPTPAVRVLLSPVYVSQVNGVLGPLTWPV